MYKYVVWDFDGTLIDSYPEAIDEYKTILDSFGISYDIDLIKDYLIRFTSKETKEYMRDNYNLNIEKFEEEYKRISNTDEAISKFEFLDDAKETCIALKEKGIKNYIYTNRDIAAVKTIDKLNANDLFEDIIYIGKDGLSKRKPDPEGLQYLINKYNMDPSEILYIGDRDLDVITSSKCNVDCAVYNPIDGYKTTPKFIINKFMDILDIIK